MGFALLAEEAFEEAPEASVALRLAGAYGIGAILSDPVFWVGLASLGLFLEGERDTSRISPAKQGSPLEDLDLRSVSDGRRWFPSPSFQNDLGFNLDGTPVVSVVPFEDHVQNLLDNPLSRTRRRGLLAPSPRAQPARQQGRAFYSPYSFAYPEPRVVVDCVRRFRRRRVLFAKRRLWSHSRKRYRPGAVSCFGY